ncbi:VIT family protein [Paracoccus sp. S-4012]|uniref:VIT1/CCC1 transporter family protein n=1 Tax=Paracoccus sp. S-4012 TaxID=2665648 RepID=UPI0012AF448B|nr:VIT family protein [Paracoccus sp. S-4012]MRX50949.1 VIT family protein [Paracoccus sp. S-4012]
MSIHTHPEAHPEDPHYITRSGWLRAAVLGANDGVVSTSSLLAGVIAAGAAPGHVLLTGLAGLAAGALSMAAGEYVSVSSQADIERADIRREKIALRENPHIEEEELTRIYERRGLSPGLAAEVARELHDHDALAAHMRDELGLDEMHAANPVLAALASGVTFTVAGAVPLIAAIAAPEGSAAGILPVVTLIALAGLGGLGARAGGAPVGRAAARAVVWGAAAMAVTALIGRLVGTAL